MKLKILFIVYDPCPLNYRTMEGYYGTNAIVVVSTKRKWHLLKALGYFPFWIFTLYFEIYMEQLIIA